MKPECLEDSHNSSQTCKVPNQHQILWWNTSLFREGRGTYFGLMMRIAVVHFHNKYKTTVTCEIFLYGKQYEDIFVALCVTLCFLFVILSSRYPAMIMCYYVNCISNLMHCVTQNCYVTSTSQLQQCIYREIFFIREEAIRHFAL